MRVGAVFIMHVGQLQVRAATPIPFVALRSAAPSARVSESGNCWGVGPGGGGGGADGTVITAADAVPLLSGPSCPSLRRS